MTVMSLTAWRALGGFAEQSKSFTSTYREGSGGINRYCRVLKRTLSMLEPYEVKVSRTVLRGLGAGNSPRLPDAPEASSFLAFAIFSIKRRFYEVLIGFWCW